MPRIDLIKLRRGTEAEWFSANPTLANGEYGFETDTRRSKIGDGTTAWNDLDYLSVPVTGTLPPIENIYTDITELLANQGSQTEGFLQKVTDASGDDDVNSGRAYYLKTDASTASLDDYIRQTDDIANALDAGQGSETADCGTVIPLDTIYGHNCNMQSANSNTSYTVNNENLINSYARVKINASSEPTVSGATQQGGIGFVPNTDMILLVENLGDAGIVYSFNPVSVNTGEADTLNSVAQRNNELLTDIDFTDIADDRKIFKDRLSSEGAHYGIEFSDNFVRLYNSTDATTFGGSYIDVFQAGISKNNNEITTFSGTWNASTNSPTLANTDTGVKAVEYKVSVAGTQDFGAGDITFNVDDIVANDGTIWYKKVDNNQLPISYSLPSSDGTAGQVLTTDGSGQVTFEDVTGVTGDYQGQLAIADTPSADGYYFASETGTYTNAGNLVVDLNNGLSIITVSGTQTVFDLIEIPISALPTGEVAEGETDAVSGDKIFQAIQNQSIQGINYFSNQPKLGVNSNGASSDPSVSYFQGTGLVPVTTGETLYVILPDFNDDVLNYQRVPLSLYDSSENWLETIDYSQKELNTLVEVEITNPSAAYAVASVNSGTFSSPVSADGYYLFKKSELNDVTKNFIDEIREAKTKIVIDESEISDLDSVTGGTVTNNLVTSTGSTQVYVTDKVKNVIVEDGVNYTICYRVDVELMSATDVLIEVSYRSNESRKWTLKQNEKITIFGIETSGQASLRIGNVGDVQFSNIRKVALNDIAFQTLQPSWAITDAFDKGDITQTVDIALNAVAIPIKARYNKVVWFGDSITQGTYGGFVPLVMQRLGAPYLNLAMDGSSPAKKTTHTDTSTGWNLRDDNLANIPSDAGVVVIGGGVNYENAPIGNDIETRDRETAYGSLNYAIDYIQTNHPYARIILFTPIPKRTSPAPYTATPITVWNTAFRDVAENRGVILADVAKYAGFTDKRVGLYMYDGNHPNNDGNYSIAAVLVNAIRKIMY